MTRSALISFALFLFFIQSCGYSLVGKGTTLPPEITRIDIPLFENRVGEPNLETTVTRAVKTAFIHDGRLRVSDAKISDATIIGVIEGYSIRPLTYDASNRVTGYQVTIVAVVDFLIKNRAKPYMRQRVETTWQYDVDPSVTVAETARLAAIEEASDKMAERIVSLVIEAF